MAQPSGKRLFRLEFTPLEFETFYKLIEILAIAKLEFTPLEFETYLSLKAF